MKRIRYALIFIAIAGMGTLHAAKETEKHKKIVASRYTPKNSTRHSKAEAKSYKIKSTTKPKAARRPVGASRPEAIRTQPAKTQAGKITTATRPNQESTLSKVSRWVGLGAAGTAGAAAVSNHRAAGYHVGPRDWHHNFPSWWASRGWTADTVDGIWYFGGHPLDWWQKHYPTYYKDAVHPEYLKTHSK